MRAILCFGLINIIAFIETSEVKPKFDKKSINLALETVFEFDKKDHETDVKVIDNVQQFLNKIKNVLTKDKVSRRHGAGEITFTDFLENAIIIIKSYKDEDIESLVRIADGEIRKYHYRGCKFYELLNNNAMRRFMSDKLDEIRNTPVPKIRKKLDQYLKKVQRKSFTSEDRKLMEYIDSLYKMNSSLKLKDFLMKLRSFGSQTKRSNRDLTKIIRHGLRSILFDHYTNLNSNVRRDLKLKLEAFWITDKTTPPILNKQNKNFDALKEKKHDKEKHTKPKTDSDEFITERHKHHKSKHNRHNAFEDGLKRIPLSSNESEPKRKRKHSKKVFSTRSDRFQTLWVEARTLPKKHKDKRNPVMRMVEHPQVREIIADHNAMIQVEGSTTSPIMRNKKAFTHWNYHNLAQRFRKWDENQSSTIRPQRTITKEKFKKKFGASRKGLSADDFEEDYYMKHGFRKHNVNDTFETKRNLTVKEKDEETIHSYVLNKLNNLEKAMEDVKHKIDGTKLDMKETTVKPTTASTARDKFLDLHTWASWHVASKLTPKNDNSNTTQKITQVTKTKITTETESTTPDTITSLSSMETTVEPTVPKTTNASTTTEETIKAIFRTGSSNESNYVNPPSSSDTKQDFKQNVIPFSNVHHDLNATLSMENFNETNTDHDDDDDNLDHEYPQQINNETLSIHKINNDIIPDYNASVSKLDSTNISTGLPISNININASDVTKNDAINVINTNRRSFNEYGYGLDGDRDKGIIEEMF